MKIRKKSFAVEYKLVLFPRVGLYTRVIYSESKLQYCICDIKMEMGIHGSDSVSTVVATAWKKDVLPVLLIFTRTILRDTINVERITIRTYFMKTYGQACSPGLGRLLLTKSYL
jgi:hypothetical protein